MKIRNTTVITIVLLAGGLSFAADRGPQWKSVGEAISKGLPKTAVERLGPIVDEAIRARNWPEAIRAIAQKAALQGAIEGDRSTAKLVAFQEEIARAPREMRPAMEAILAHWYWHYYQNHRWRFHGRSTTVAAPSDDIATWDLPRLHAEIARHFDLALADAAALQRIPIESYDALLEKGNAPTAWRPTLYDFLVHQALEFHASGEFPGARPEDVFELSAEGPILGSPEEFLAWKPTSTDEASPTFRAVRLLQDLLRFHAGDRDRSAFLDADLARLAYGKNAAAGEEKNARYKAALEALANRHPDHELSARALHARARTLHEEGKLAAAREVAKRGTERFPQSLGARANRNLIREIEVPSLAVAAERVWNAAGPRIDVRYRNLRRVHFRLLPASVDDVVADPGDGFRRDRKVVDALLAARPIRAWTETLEPTTDFRERLRTFAAPRVAKGVYRLIASPTADFDPERPLQFTTIWVSDLALVLRNSGRGASHAQGMVLNAITGEPIEGARLRFWFPRNGRRVPGSDATSDAAGRFELPGAHTDLLVVASHRGDRLAAADAVGTHRYGERHPPFSRTIFFTDRAIYRPGQSIHYKGVAFDVDREADRYEVAPARRVTVIFADGNGKEVERHDHSTNDHGSFDGTFTAPSDRLLGVMSIRVDGSASGMTQFRVEEYKRPKFQVAIEPPKEARLGDRVIVAGQAAAYTGASVDGAEVRWRVVREVQYPLWRRSWWWAPPRPSQEIGHGRARTGADGRFEMSFVARPDPEVDAEHDPVFRFRVHADVTDPAGETRSSARTVSIGAATMAAALAVDEWQVVDRPVEIQVSTATLDGLPTPASGAVTIHRLRSPSSVERPPLSDPRLEWENPRGRGPEAFGAVRRADPTSWEDGERVAERFVETDTAGRARVAIRLEPGLYRARFAGRDAFGARVRAELPVRVLDPGARRLAIPVPDLLVAPRWTVEPGEEFVALWGSGYERARAFVEIEHRGVIVDAYWTGPDRTQHVVRRRVTEGMRGGFTIRVSMVRENRAYLHAMRVDVPWTNRELSVRWERLVSKLEPGQRVTWTAVVTGPDATRAVAEMAATLYDASLDAFAPHAWPRGFGDFRQEPVGPSFRFENQAMHLSHVIGAWPHVREAELLDYHRFPGSILGQWVAAEHRSARRVRALSAAPPMLGRAASGAAANDELHSRGGRSEELQVKFSAVAATAMDAAAVDPEAALQVAEGAGAPGQVVPRRILQETAFFFPRLTSNANGEVRLQFTMPEALTEWRFLGFAHDRDLRAGLLEDRVVTSKDLMVQPNPPRFLREDDVLEFTVKVTNRTAETRSGRVRLALSDAHTGDAVDDAFGNVSEEQPFNVPGNESRTYAWRLQVPDGGSVLVYRATATSGNVSDGEEGWLPVLSRRILVTESLPLPMRGQGTRTFDFARLGRAGASTSLRHRSLTVQMVSNPSWYAVMALPYLMEFPHECTEQTFNRLYANALAHHIATSDPRIEAVFDRWRGTKTLDSPLEKNQELKAVMLEETPWLRQSDSESQARRNVGLLFDRPRLERETARIERKLRELQLRDGAWPWFPGGRPNDYITLYITAGLARLRHLGVRVADDLALRALGRLDAWAVEWHREIRRAGSPDENHLSSTAALWLYTRSFFLDRTDAPKPDAEVLDYWMGQARKYWLSQPRQSQGHLALALHRHGHAATARAIVKSLDERSIDDPELGMHWRDQELSWWWYRAPIETQAMMIEAFDEVAGDSAKVEACKVWLLKQKQTRDWKTTKATADAVYALLLRGTGPLASHRLVEVALAGRTLDPEDAEAGTGFYERRFRAAEIRPDMSRITVTKRDPGVAWGSVHWQYLEDMGKVTAHEGTALKLVKTLYRRVASARGPLIERVNGPLAVGDELIVRLELRTDRDMEYVHLKDLRGSGLEPMNVLSGYRYQDGLVSYEQTKDTATHFFIDYLPRGTYVFEYPLRVQHLGRYQTGVARIQCMYAPEFGSHSESIALEVR